MSVRRASLAGSGAAVALAVAAFGWTARPADKEATSLDGGALFRTKGCATCHDGPDSTSPIGAFPSLAEAAAWARDRRPGMEADAYLAESIREPWVFISPAFAGGAGPTTGMPALGISNAEVDALVGYLLGD